MLENPRNKVWEKKVAYWLSVNRLIYSSTNYLRSDSKLVQKIFKKWSILLQNYLIKIGSSCTMNCSSVSWNTKRWRHIKQHVAIIVSPALLQWRCVEIINTDGTPLDPCALRVLPPTSLNWPTIQWTHNTRRAPPIFPSDPFLRTFPHKVPPSKEEFLSVWLQSYSYNTHRPPKIPLLSRELFLRPRLWIDTPAAALLSGPHEPSARRE